MKLIAVLLITSMGAGCQVPAPKPETFTEKYYKELDKANRYLKVYTNTSCTDPDFKSVEKDMITEYEAFHSLVEAIPDDEDSMVQVKEIEVFMGFKGLLTQIVQDKQDCQDAGTDKKRGYL